MSPGEYLTRQIKISAELYKKIKRYCIDHNLSLIDFYEQMIVQFLDGFEHDKAFVFQASQKVDYRLSIYIKKIHAKKINQLAKQFSVSEARIINTAFNNYVRHLELIPN